MPEKFHHYHLTETLSKKYSHVTYLASPTEEPECQVVLTVFASLLFRFPHGREDLLQEAQRIKQLQHPHLVPILDVGIEEEQPFVVRKYLPGDSLRSRLKKLSPDRLQLRDALSIVSQVGEALAYAHEHHIVHGNIKPENILFDGNGQAVLADFNLVSRKDGIIRDQTSEEYAFCYLAPEQFAGTCDARSDQYALGCLTYELVTGGVPFAVQSLASMMGQGNALPAPLSESVAGLAPSLDAAVIRALAQDPDERFFDFSLFLEVIKSVLSPPSTIFQISWPFNDPLSAQPMVTSLPKKATLDLLLADPFTEEEAVDELAMTASGSSVYSLNEDTVSDKSSHLASSLMRSADVRGSWVRQALHSRRRALGLVLLLSVIVALLISTFWSIGKSTPDTHSNITQNMAQVGIKATKNIAKVQATTNPTLQPSAQATAIAMTQPVAAVASIATTQPSSPTATVIARDPWSNGTGSNGTGKGFRGRS